MAEVEPRDWWAEVQHLREPLERRSGARRSERRVSGGRVTERRTVKIRGQVSVPGAPRRELRDAPGTELGLPYDLEALVSERERRPETTEPRPRLERARRPSPRPRERIASRPDRIAAWAVVSVLAMALIAATSAHGAAAHGPQAAVASLPSGSAAPLNTLTPLSNRSILAVQAR